MADYGNAADLLDENYLRYVARLAYRDHSNALIAEQAPNYPVDDLCEPGQDQRLPLGVVNTSDRIAESPSGRAVVLDGSQRDQSGLRQTAFTNRRLACYHKLNDAHVAF